MERKLVAAAFSFSNWFFFSFFLSFPVSASYLAIEVYANTAISAIVPPSEKD
jgi:hypothetical protein